jgi:hypothetical protein
MANSRIRSLLKIFADQPPTEVPVLILGESHTIILARAVENAENSPFVSVDVRSGSDDSKINFDLFSFFRPGKVVLAFGGNEHNIIGMFEAEPKYDFLLPPFDDFDTGRTLIPAAAIEEVIHLRLHGGVKRALRARQLFDCPAYTLAPPPPFLAIDDRTTMPKAFSDLLDAGVAPAPIRRKLYALQCALMKSVYEEHGVAFIDAPREARDADGFLLRKLWGRDPTHGNLRYGRLLIQHLADQLGLEAEAIGKKANV